MVISIVNLSVATTSPYRIIEFSMITPESISDTPSAPLYEAYSIAGRSAPPQSYSGGDTRSMSFSLNLHRDLLDVPSNYLFYPSNIPEGSGAAGTEAAERRLSDDFELLLNQLRALNYPFYNESGVVPPRVYCRVGDSLRIKGFCSVSFEYKRPMRFNRFMNVEVSFDFQEITDISFSADEIINGMQRYVTYHDAELR